MISEARLYRSVFFVPGDSDKKIAKLPEIATDAVVYDLEDSVLPAAKPAARERVVAALSLSHRPKQTRMVRVNPLDTPLALEDLAAVMPGKPDAIMQPKIRSAADVLQLAHYLDALEAREGIAIGSTKILPIATETPAALFNLSGFANNVNESVSRRLSGLTWGAEDLSTALGASGNKASDGSWAFTYHMARSQCLLAARAARVQSSRLLWCSRPARMGGWASSSRPSARRLYAASPSTQAWSTLASAVDG